jgi:hypothetical protein
MILLHAQHGLSREEMSRVSELFHAPGLDEPLRIG